MRAIIFDFNGVIADDETPHVHCFQRALAEAGLSLSVEDYYGAYLGMDERTCASLLLAARDGAVNEALLERITVRKADLFRLQTAGSKPALFPGVVEFVKAAKGHFLLSIASGGRKAQIQAALAGTAIERDFDLTVAAEDCAVGKPDPAIYWLTLERLRMRVPDPVVLQPADCLVIEDSLAGIRSAQAAGMRVVAVATTYPPDKLSEADMILPALAATTPSMLVRDMAQIGHGSRFKADRASR